MSSRPDLRGGGLSLVRAALETEVYILVMLLGIIFVSLVLLWFWRRQGKGVHEQYTRKLMECLQPRDSLPPLLFPGIEYAFNRRILIRLLSELAVVLAGVEGRILRLIFHDNGLYRHILHECRAGDDYRKVMALSVFQDVPLPEELVGELGRFHDSRNSELRMIALLVHLNGRPGEMMNRLATWPHELSDRDCANIYALAQRCCVPVPEVEKLLTSANPSVVRFGQRVLKMKGFTV
jgi:hypothetical protein